MIVRRIAVCVLLLAICAGLAAATQEEVVYFNVRSHKYHCLTCYHARRCTANCIEVTISEAKKRGGVPCKVCGGTCNAEIPRGDARSHRPVRAITPEPAPAR